MALSLSSWATAASVGGPAPLAVELKSSTITPEGHASNRTNPPPLPRRPHAGHGEADLDMVTAIFTQRQAADARGRQHDHLHISLMRVFQRQYRDR
jgi:hypothetical protein